LHNVDATGLNLVKASNNANTLSGNLLWRGTDNENERKKDKDRKEKELIVNEVQYYGCW
jgi:hypothetical protein